MKEFKIQNLMLIRDVDTHIQDVPELLYASDSVDAAKLFSYNNFEKCHVMKKFTTVDFGRYLNVISMEKWKKYTFAKNFKLKLTVCGKAYLEVYEMTKNSFSVVNTVTMTANIDAPIAQEFIFDIPDSNAPLVGYKITAVEDFAIYSGAVFCEVEDSEISRVKLSLATTTFKKEAFIRKNIALLKKDILESDEMKDSIYVHVVDNGRTLNPEEFNCRNLKVTPNPNVGGSGGFAKGMMEALSIEDKPTHVLLMDDDVLILSESLFRTFYLLRIVRPEYKDHFISGAMFDYDKKFRQHEDVGRIRTDSASFGPVKWNLNMKKPKNLLLNEEQSNWEKDHMYAAWWYCCIPVKFIEQNGLPLPIFVRGDDVEFSIRNKARFITLDGVCIWHVGFGAKFSASMEAYQVFRNGMIIKAVSGVAEETDHLKVIERFFWHELWRFAYNNAEQLLDVLDDFMKGPEWLASVNSEDVFKAHGAKNEKMIPIEEFPPQYNVLSRCKKKKVYTHMKISLPKRAWYAITCNGHFWPKVFLHKYPEVTACDWYDIPAKNCMRERLVAVNVNDKTGVLRVRDVKRCKELIKRHKKVIANYKKNHEAVEKQFRDYSEKFRSWEFWQEYLKNQSKD